MRCYTEEANWRGGRVVEGARLESVFRGNSNVGSNPTLSATFVLLNLRVILRFRRARWYNECWLLSSIAVTTAQICVHPCVLKAGLLGKHAL